MIICRENHERYLFHRGNVHSFVKSSGLHPAFADTRKANEIFFSSKSLRHQCAYRNGNHSAEMADHREFVIARMPSMDIAVAPTHRTRARAEIRAGDVDQRFAKRRSPSLVTNQRRKNVAFF